MSRRILPKVVFNLDDLDSEQTVDSRSDYVNRRYFSTATASGRVWSGWSRDLFVAWKQRYHGLCNGKVALAGWADFRPCEMQCCSEDGPLTAAMSLPWTMSGHC